MRARYGISYEFIEKLLKLPEDWEVVAWEPDDSRSIAFLRVHIDSTDLPVEARKQQVYVEAVGEEAEDWTWMIRATGPYLTSEPGAMRFRETAKVEYHQWRKEMIAGLRCPKCFWPYGAGIGNRVVSEWCESCASE